MAKGTGIRIRCKVCRKLGRVESECTAHRERVYEWRIRTPHGWESGTCDSYEQAKIDRSEVYKQLHQGTYRKVEPITFNQMADRWLSEQHSELEFHVKEQYRRIIAAHMRPVFGEVKMAAITTEDISNLRNKYKSMSIAFKNHLNRILGSIFRLALYYGFITKNVTIMARKPMPKAYERIEILTPPQIAHLLNVCRPANRLYYQMAIYTGLRAQELIALDYSKIDYKRKKIIVDRALRTCSTKIERETYKSSYRFKVCKTPSSHREVPIGDDLLEAIGYHRLQASPNPLNLVFAGRTGRPFIETNKSLEFNEDCAKARETMPDFPVLTFHKLRHTYCSILMDQGVDLKTIQELMGHADEKLIMKIYAHVNRYKKDYAAIAKGLEDYLRENADSGL